MRKLAGALALLAALALGAAALSPALAADLMRKQPYLIYPGDPAQMEVLWQLTATAGSTIAWGTDTTCALGNASSDEYGDDHQHAYVIGGLDPATLYYYRVTTDGVAYGGSFRSAPASDATRLKFLAYGDTRSQPAVHNTVAQGMINTYTADPDYQTMAAFVGDFVFYGNSETSWTNEFFSPAYPAIRELMAHVPFQVAMGNHEMSLPILYTKYFPFPWVDGRYWSFDYGPAHFTVIDQYTAYTADSPQAQWIADDLIQSRKLWKFVILHEPGWSSGGGHANNVTVQTVLEPLFEMAGVSIVFGGHNHYYARAVVNGVQHVTTGGGGAPIANPQPGYPNIVKTAPEYHFCTIDIDGTQATFRALATMGIGIDSFTVVRTPVDATRPSAPDAGVRLSAPVPNPGRGATTLGFALPHAGWARLEIIDLAGRTVWARQELVPAGACLWTWDGRAISGAQAGTGLYFVRLRTAWGARTQRLAWFRG